MLQNLSDWIESTALHQWLASQPWNVPPIPVQTIHIFGVAVIFGTVLMINLRLLGWAERSLPLRDTVNRYRPIFWVSVVVLLLSGLLLLITEPDRIVVNFSFWAKMGALLVGIILAQMLFSRVHRGEEFGTQGGTAAVFGARTQAMFTLLLWIVIIFLGRFIAYDTQIWGTLSPMYE